MQFAREIIPRQLTNKYQIKQDLHVARETLDSHIHHYLETAKLFRAFDGTHPLTNLADDRWGPTHNVVDRYQDYTHC